MAVTVGGIALNKSYVGGAETKKIYVGTSLVWPVAVPPTFTTKIEYVGSTVTSSAASMAFPTHQAGDLLVVAAVGGAAPTPPGSGGYTDAHVSPTGNPAARISYKWATAPNTSVGTWAGIASATCYVFRGVNTTTPFGTIETTLSSGVSVTATAPPITLTDPSGESLVVNTHYNNATTGSWNNTTPPGFLIKNLQARMANSQKYDTTTGEGSTMTHNQTSQERCISWELLAPQTAEPPYLYDVEQVNKGGGVVDFTLKKGLTGIDPLDEGFMFRCAQFSTLNGYVPRTFSKTFPTNGYAALDCTVEDLYGDGTANPDYLHKIISFQVRPSYGAAADATTAAAGAIKGNADSGLYHLPTDPHYAETVAEQWFDTEADAQAAGFTKYVRKTTRKKKT